MATKPGLGPQQHAHLPGIIKLQVGLAVVATTVTVALALYIPQLVKARNNLEAQITNLSTTRDGLQQQINDAKAKLDEAKKQLAATLDAVADQDSGVGHSTVNAPAPGARIFEHIGNKDQRPRAKLVAEGLQRQGFAVPGVQILVDYKSPETQVRYFHPEDQAEANKIVAALGAQGVKDVVAKPISGYENTVHPRQFEIWFGSKAW